MCHDCSVAPVPAVCSLVLVLVLVALVLVALVR